MELQPRRIKNISIVKRTVLIMDSNESRCDSRAGLLRLRGVDVICTHNHEQALQAWRADAFDLVMLDTTQDRESAVQLCSYIRGRSTSQRVVFFVGEPGYLSSSPGPTFAA